MSASDLPSVGVLVSGRGSNLQAIYDCIARGELRARVSVVISSRSDAPALGIAAAHGSTWHTIIPREYSSKSEAGEAIIAALRAGDVQVVALAGYKPILDPKVVRAYPDAILNVHPSLLPAFGGGMAPRPQREALEAGVKVSGCTVHFVTDEVDAGPIIAQAAVPVLDDDDVETLSARILVEEHRLLPQAIGLILSNRLKIDGRRVIMIAAEAQ
jgi:phosphoribosylglycinamide formyltransferase-1